ncbi:hypothetical protein HYW46_01415 [Candidatus Daviesbacteria bacterium]|nr:hypothetical protein [Candidatus Daviesbacteria bacterium]
MFSSVGQKIVVGIILLLIVLIPTGSLLLAQRFKTQDNPNPTPLPKIQPSPKEVPKTTPLDDLKKSLEGSPSKATPEPSSSSTPQVFFGPTLNFKISIEGRPKNSQAAKTFLGIAAGMPTTNPQYLLSFTVDIPATGGYSGLSLAGLTQGSTYTAYLKGPAQLASASAFLVKPTVSDLGTLNLITGDLNEDNVINSADFAVAKNAYGTNPLSAKWNSNVDFNLDKIINGFDLGIIIKNLGKTGNSGVWGSIVATGSASLQPSIGSPDESSATPKPPPGSKGGYWMWVPQF